MIDIFNNFYKGKRVLVTGHTGFKGSWLSIWLHELGAEVVGVGLRRTTLFSLALVRRLKQTSVLTFVTERR